MLEDDRPRALYRASIPPDRWASTRPAVAAADRARPPRSTSEGQTVLRLGRSGAPNGLRLPANPFLNRREDLLLVRGQILEEVPGEPGGSSTRAFATGASLDHALQRRVGERGRRDAEAELLAAGEPRGQGCTKTGRQAARRAGPPSGRPWRSKGYSRRPGSTKVKAALFQSVDPAGRRLTGGVSRRLSWPRSSGVQRRAESAHPRPAAHTFSGDRDRKPVAGTS